MSRVVLVTGCSTGGIGFALCEAFARRGCKVYATSRNVGTIGDFQEPGIRKLALDVARVDEIQRVVRDIVEWEGKIDIVVNNAGFITPGPIIDQTSADIQRTFDTNVFAVLHMAKTVMPVMAKRRSGVIVNIGSVVGEVATPWNGLYCASKAALQSISDVLSMEARPFNISVVHVAPGAVKSKISANGGAHYRLADDSLYSAFLPNIMQRIYASQANPMPTEIFANQLVTKALQPNPPAYVLLGGMSWLFKIFKWLPKSWVLGLMWRTHSRKISGVPS